MPPFTPITTTKNVAATTSTGSVAMGQPSTALAVGRTARVYNAGSVAAFIEFGASTVTATTTASLPIAPGAVEVFGVGSSDTHMAAILASSTGTVYVTLGDGI